MISGLEVVLRNVVFLVLGMFKGFQSHKGWKNSNLGNPCQEINLQLRPRRFFSSVRTLQSRHLLQVFFTSLPKPNFALGSTKLTFSSTIAILLGKLDYSQLFTYSVLWCLVAVNFTAMLTFWSQTYRWHVLFISWFKYLALIYSRIKIAHSLLVVCLIKVIENQLIWSFCLWYANQNLG